MKADLTDLEKVTQRINEYFEGIHNADAEKLRNVFDPNAHLQAPSLRLTLDEWLQRVVNRAVPSATNQRFDYRIISIDLSGEQAMAKVECPLLGNFYIDFLSLLKEDSRWRIVNKMYAHAPLDYQPILITGE